MFDGLMFDEGFYRRTLFACSIDISQFKRKVAFLQTFIRGHPYIMSALRGEGGLAQKKM